MAKKKIKAGNVVTQIILVIQSILVLFPLYLIITTSFKSNQELVKNYIALPWEWCTDGYRFVFESSTFPRYALNTLYVTALSVVGAAILSVMLSYAIIRYNYKINKFFYLFVIAGMMIPLRLGILYIVEMITAINLVDSLYGLLLIYLVTSLPFSVFVITGFLKMLPTDMEEAACIDGCGELRCLWQIVIPMLKPAILTVTLFNFVGVWNDVYFPLMLIRSEEQKTLMLGVMTFFGQFSNDWNKAFSALSLSAVPSVLLYAFTSKYLVQGLIAGAIKG